MYNPAQILCERVLCDELADMGRNAPPLDEPASDHLGFLQTFETRITRPPYSSQWGGETPDWRDPVECVESERGYTGTLAGALQRCARHHYGQSVDLKFAIEEAERIRYREYR